MYKVKQEALIGQIEGFPLEVVQRMVEEQVKQGNKADVTVFQESANSEPIEGGFLWTDTSEGFNFWEKVIGDKNFDKFFEKYPKIDTHVYYRGVPERGNEICAELEKIGGIKPSPNWISYEGKGTFYFINPFTKEITFDYDNSEAGNALALLKECYTEKFLPEKDDIIEIDSKKYKKYDVVNRIKGLKEIE